MSKHPNIWDFIQKLILIENQYFVELNQARNNYTIRNTTSREQRFLKTENIRQHIQALNIDGDILMFLRRVGHQNDGYVQGQIGPFPDNNI